MRLNKFIAHASGVSRREADQLIAAGKVTINDTPVTIGADVSDSDIVKLNGAALHLPQTSTVLAFNKPVGYVCSRKAQAKDVETIYAILPKRYHKLKTIGRLDKDSSGLILLTDDGDLAFHLTHPKFAKTKEYLVTLDQPLQPLHQQMIADFGVNLPDGNSKLGLERLNDTRTEFKVTMHEGRNRQIRRTFASLGYTVIKLHRINFDGITLSGLASGAFLELTPREVALLK